MDFANERMELVPQFLTQHAPQLPVEITWKFRDRDNFFSAGFISVSHDFTPYFHFRCVARATFDRNLIHSADACFLVMACVGYSRVQLKTLSSLLKSHFYSLEAYGTHMKMVFVKKPNNVVRNAHLVCRTK